MTAPVKRLLERIGSGGAPPAAMLRQDARHFAGLSTRQAEALRGRILAAFEPGDLADDALAAIREELRTSLSPAVLAGAARAVRGLGSVDEETATLLRAASERIASSDEPVRLGDRSPPLTARQEIAAALAAAPARRPCCAAAPTVAAEAPEFALCAAALEGVVVEDQSGARTRLAALLRGRTSLVAFFYTRCMNPAKCSLTVTRLGAFARQVRESGAAPVTVLACSYDGRFDTAARLREFGRDRDFDFADDARLVRCLAGWPAVRRAFGLRVGYGPATVNDHARELFAVGPDLSAVGLEPEALADPVRLGRKLAEFAVRPDESSRNN